jgi:hypothetical protein
MAIAKRVKKSEKEKLSRLKLMLFGTSGAGKTYGSIWPNSYIIDGEKGTVHYDDLLVERHCARVSTPDTEEACKHIKSLMSQKHDYKTLVIDPVTAFYENTQQKWNDLFVNAAKADGNTQKAEMQDFGFRYWGKVKSEQKAMISLLKKVDMNVIVTAHEKDKYGDSMKVLGQTYDGLKGLDYFFDTVIRLIKDPNSERRTALTLKDRTQKFPSRFDYTYDRIAEIWGKDIERESTIVELATPEQVEEIQKLLAALKIAPDWETKCLSKADVESWNEIDKDQAEKCLDYLRNLLPKSKD